MKIKINMSLSSGHSKHMARLREAERAQHSEFTIGEIIQIMSGPEFDKYYHTTFQAYLAGNGDILTTSDQQNNDRAYLDVVAFLSTQLGATQPVKNVRVGNRDGMNMGTINVREGSRKGITFARPRKTEDQ